ncbi:MAG: MlaD family protein [Pseudomonadota bacterium]
METRANFALIGAFVLMTIMAVVAFVLWLGSSQLNREFSQYDIIFDGPVTLEEGAAVRYIGIKVGEVETVRIDNRDAAKVRARIRVDRQTPVKEDSTAVIDFAGITGVTFIQITAGSDTAGPLRVRPNQDVPIIPAGETPLVELFSSGAEIAGRASMMLTDDNLLAFDATLKSVQSVMAVLADNDEALVGGAIDTLETLNRAADRLAAASDATIAVAGSVDSELKQLNDELLELTSQLNRVADEAELVLLEGREALDLAGQLLEGGGADMVSQGNLASQDLRALINRLDRITRDIEQNPQRLVVGDPKPYEEPR